MKLALLVVAALALTGVTLVSTADEAAACIPPNCPGYMTCKIHEDEAFRVEEPVTGGSYVVTTPSIVCYY